MFKGVCTALVTPFDENNNINFEMLGKIIENQIESGVSALLFLGTTGESPTLSEEERISIIRFAVEKVKHRVPVLVGVGTNCTEETIERAKKFKNLGVDGVLIVSPYYNKPTQKGLYQHFKKIALAVDVPIILYNVPSRTEVNIEPQTIVELSKIKNIVGLKQANSSMGELMAILNDCDKDFFVYSGEDDLIYSMLCLGAKGVISVASNVEPKFMSELCQNFFNGEIEKSRDMQFKINPFIKGLFCETNPIPVKYAMKLTGYDVGKPRLPLVELSQKEKVCSLIKDFEKIKHKSK